MGRESFPKGKSILFEVKIIKIEVPQTCGAPRDPQGSWKGKSFGIHQVGKDLQDQVGQTIPKAHGMCGAPDPKGVFWVAPEPDVPHLAMDGGIQGWQIQDFPTS